MTGKPSNKRELDGYLATTANGMIFLQWTRDGSQLTGSAQLAELERRSSAEVDENNVSFRGVISDDELTLDFSGLVKWNGRFVGRDLLLSFPNDAGALQSARFRPATIADYQAQVATLRDRAEELNVADAEAERRRQADERRAQAEAAVLGRFRSTCAERGGSLSAERANEVGYDAPGPNSAGEFCIVAFAGQGTFQVPIRTDGSFFTEAANLNRDQCALDAEDARLSAEDGQPWRRQPEYHAKAGVCYRGERG